MSHRSQGLWTAQPRAELCCHLERTTTSTSLRPSLTLLLQCCGQTKPVRQVRMAQLVWCCQYLSQRTPVVHPCRTLLILTWLAVLNTQESRLLNLPSSRQPPTETARMCMRTSVTSNTTGATSTLLQASFRAEKLAVTQRKRDPSSCLRTSLQMHAMGEKKGQYSFLSLFCDTALQPTSSQLLICLVPVNISWFVPSSVPSVLFPRPNTSGILMPLQL